MWTLPIMQKKKFCWLFYKFGHELNKRVRKFSVYAEQSNSYPTSFSDCMTSVKHSNFKPIINLKTNRNERTKN